MQAAQTGLCRCRIHRAGSDALCEAAAAERCGKLLSADGTRCAVLMPTTVMEDGNRFVARTMTKMLIDVDSHDPLRVAAPRAPPAAATRDCCTSSRAAMHDGTAKHAQTHAVLPCKVRPRLSRVLAGSVHPVEVRAQLRQLPARRLAPQTHHVLGHRRQACKRGNEHWELGRWRGVEVEARQQHRDLNHRKRSQQPQARAHRRCLPAVQRHRSPEHKTSSPDLNPVWRCDEGNTRQRIETHHIPGGPTGNLSQRSVPERMRNACSWHGNEWTVAGALRSNAEIHVLASTAARKPRVEKREVVDGPAADANVGRNAPGRRLLDLGDRVEVADPTRDNRVLHPRSRRGQLCHTDVARRVGMASDRADVGVEEPWFGNHIVVEEHCMISKALRQACVPRRARSRVGRHDIHSDAAIAMVRRLWSVHDNDPIRRDDHVNARHLRAYRSHPPSLAAGLLLQPLFVTLERLGQHLSPPNDASFRVACLSCASDLVLERRVRRVAHSSPSSVQLPKEGVAMLVAELGRKEGASKGLQM
eukprot:2632927-Rhodomonas_salina.1